MTHSSFKPSTPRRPWRGVLGYLATAVCCVTLAASIVLMADTPPTADEAPAAAGPPPRPAHAWAAGQPLHFEGYLGLPSV